MEAVRMVQPADGDVATDELRARLRRMWSAVAGGWAVPHRSSTLAGKP